LTDEAFSSHLVYYIYCVSVENYEPDTLVNKRSENAILLQCRYNSKHDSNVTSAGSSPKSNQFLLVTYRAHPKFHQIPTTF